RALPGQVLAAQLPPPPKGRTLVLGAGKAGGAMVQALEAAWPAEAPLSGLVITRYGHIPGGWRPRRVELVEAAHPVPDAAGLAASEAPAADLMRIAFGRGAELLMVGVVTLSALSVMNALLIAGPRTTYAAARDLAAEWHLARWNHARGTPTGAVIATAAVALALVAFGDLTRGGFSTMVDYLS
ncbi:amino acid permease, partial [Escherichia coli]|uniref:amino acid permease n=1 Tax=Escherichia coli TaxID=562 RepID=UPI00129004EB